MSRFGHKQVLTLWSEVDVNLFYRVIPGLQVETFGKPEFFTNYMCSSSYVWSDYLVKKININYHHGCSPFLYAHSMLKESNLKRSDTLVFLPKSDITTKLDGNCVSGMLENLPKACDFLSFTTDYGCWSNILGFEKVKVIGNYPYHSSWNFDLCNLLNSYKTIYFPFFSSAVLYALYCDCKIKFYDFNDIFKESDINPILESYDVSKFSKENIDIQNYLKEVFSDESNDEQKYIVKTFLSTEKRQSPEDLLKSLFILHEKSFRKKYLIEDYYENYLSSNNINELIEVKNKYQFYTKSEYLKRIDEKCRIYDNSEGSKEIKKLIEKL